MNRTKMIMSFMGYTEEQLEERLMQDWLRWCHNRAMLRADTTPDGQSLEVVREDFQNLIADTALFHSFKKMYVDCLLDFLEDVKDMAPRPSIKEAHEIYQMCVKNSHRLYNNEMIRSARNKKIECHVNN
ncbi:hypothetical protein [Spongiimicrobium salis]|uniref:hypothetical protein n=1 Tax=Spongiimicrobium salis TaxID=1667022 RepID=UPI00374CEBF9